MMALRSITLPDLEKGRGCGLWLDLRNSSCSLSNSGLYRVQWHPSFGSIPHEVAARGLLVGEGLRAAQAGLVPLHQVPHSWATRTALSRERPGLGRRVGHTGSELQLQFHVLAQLGGERQISIPAWLPGPRPPFKSSSPLTGQCWI